MNRKTTDFSHILEELRAAGINDYKMAELTGIDRSMLSKLRSGDRKQPNYDDGTAIMEIYIVEVSQKT
jgi:transcriptional regulator with XRE-family HTH domain